LYVYEKLIPDPTPELSMVTPRKIPDMIEGPDAFQRFQDAVKAVLRVPKSALPPSPFGKSKRVKKNTKPPKD
jgi:hypothetical protein